MKSIALAIPLAVVLAASVYGQTGGPPPPGGPGQGRFALRLGPELGMRPWNVVTGEPYSATVTEQHTQTLANGTTISRTTTGQVARDSSGRTYVQQTITSGPFFNPQNGPQTVVFITDPVAGYSYVLHSAKKIAIRRPFHPRSSNGSVQRTKPPRQGNANVTTTDLGTQTDATSGLELQGKEVTRTIPAGAIGNSQAIVSVSETWYSPVLQVVVRSTRNDPRFGQTTYTLSNISQNEPDPSLFTVPAGYTVQDAPRFRGPGGANRSQ